MRKHIKIYYEYFKLGEQDIVLCEACGKKATDIHHLVPRSLGGQDTIINLCALCRSCHNRVHDGGDTNFNNQLKELHNKFMERAGKRFT